jgi:acyl-coenzyme A thioesterase PaaI-like protein
MPEPSSTGEEHRLEQLCDACVPVGRCRIGLATEHLEPDGEARFDLICPPEHEATHGVAHGGWTASVFDELLGRVVLMHGHMSVMGTLTISFEQPVPVGRPLAARSWVEKRDARKWGVASELTLCSSGAVLARASGVCVLRDRESHYAKFEQWLGQQ